MGKTSKPSDLPSTNDLDNVEPDKNEGLSVDAYLGFGGTPKPIVNPPHIGDIIEYRVRVECVGAAKTRRQDGEMRYTRKMAILSVARAGEELPPDANDNQGEMFDESGEATEEAVGTETSGIEGMAGADHVEGDPEKIGDVIQGNWPDAADPEAAAE